MNNIIKKFEGLSLTPYLDTSLIPTIGYGNIQYPPNFRGGGKVQMTDQPLTQKEADMIFDYWYGYFVRKFNEIVIVPVTKNQREALISLMYNIGEDQFKNSSFIQTLNSLPDEFLKWKYSGGRVVAGLVKRRKEERQLYLTQDLLFSAPPSYSVETAPKKGYNIIEAIKSLFNRKV